MKIREFLTLSLATLVSACGPTPPRASSVQYLAEPPPSFPIVAGEAGPDDIARFLAGKPVRRGAVLSRFQQTVEYQTHQREMKRVWDHFASRRVARMGDWSAVNLAPFSTGKSALLYPFGGPDLLHSLALFPQVPHHVLMGLEPVGDLPALESLAVEEVLGALPAYRQATQTQLQVGYFITKDMRSDLERSALRGVTPILLGTVSLMGGEVTSATPTSVGGKPGMELRFRSAYGSPMRATYISGDLSNSGFNAGYRGWLDAQGSAVTYFKAASYLMHDARFSSARDYFLGRSSAILQDDSGIPFRHFAADHWSIRYYGFYDKPIELFAKHHQDDLRAAYAANPRSPIPFGSGYHYDAGNANLIFAIKR